MSRLYPGMVTTIRDQRCVMLRDAVAHRLPPTDDILVLEHFDGKMVYCALSELKRARAQYPKLPAYGFWQTLFRSGLVDGKRRLQVVYFDQDNGQYLYQGAASVAFTGEVRNGKLIPAAGYTFDAETAYVISCSTGNLKIPEKAVLSFEEREHRRSSRKIRMMLHFAAFVIFSGAGFLIYDVKRQAYEADQRQLQTALASRAESLETRKAHLRQTRIGDLPDQRELIDDLLRLSISLEKFSLIETPLEHSSFEVRTPAHLAGLPSVFAEGSRTVKHHRDGLLSLYWSRAQ